MWMELLKHACHRLCCWNGWKQHLHTTAVGGKKGPYRIVCLHDMRCVCALDIISFHRVQCTMDSRMWLIVCFFCLLACHNMHVNKRPMQLNQKLKEKTRIVETEWQSERERIERDLNWMHRTLILKLTSIFPKRNYKIKKTKQHVCIMYEKCAPEVSSANRY